MKAIKYGLFILALVFSINVSFAGEMININTADVKTLAKNLKGIGPNRAKAIIKYRESHGGFKSVEELVKVKGIGKKIVKVNKDKLAVGDVAATESASTAQQ